MYITVKDARKGCMRVSDFLFDIFSFSNIMGLCI